MANFTVSPDGNTLIMPDGSTQPNYRYSIGMPPQPAYPGGSGSGSSSLWNMLQNPGGGQIMPWLPNEGQPQAPVWKPPGQAPTPPQDPRFTPRPPQQEMPQATRPMPGQQPFGFGMGNRFGMGMSPWSPWGQMHNWWGGGDCGGMGRYF